MLKKTIGLMVSISILVTMLCGVTVSAAPSLTLVKTIPSYDGQNRTAIDMCVSDKYAFVAYEYQQTTANANGRKPYTSWVEVFDIYTDPANPRYLKNISITNFDADGNIYVDEPNSRISEIRVNGNYLFVAFYDVRAGYYPEVKCVQFFDLDTIETVDNPVPVAKTETINGVISQIFNMAVNGDRMITLAPETINSKGNVTDPVSLRFYDVSEEAIETAASGTGILKKTKVVNMTDALAETAGTIGRYSVGYIDGNYFYYTNNDNTNLTLFIANISDGGFKVVGKYALSDYSNGYTATSVSEALKASEIYAEGNYVYVTTNRNSGIGFTEGGNEKNALYVIDVTNAKNNTGDAPVACALACQVIPAGTVNSNTRIEGMAVNGNYLYLWFAPYPDSSTKTAAIYMYDISDPTNVEKVTNSTPYEVVTGAANEKKHDIGFKDNYVYSCATTNGLIVHKITDSEITDTAIVKGTEGLEALVDGNLKGQITLNNYSADKYEGVLILAYYNGGQLKGVKTKPVEVQAGKKGAVVATEELAVTNGTLAKAMLWDSWKGLQPISIKEISPAQ